ncbi:putative replication factor A protein [Dioscorea sansibarensis]
MDPILSVHVKLLAVDLLSLNVQSHGPLMFTHKSRPIARAETLGVVVSRECKDKFLKFLVDDGTGCIPCILWLNHQSFARRSHPVDLELKARMALVYAEKIQLGLLVRVRGRITIYMGVIQITVADVVVERDPNMELLHWLDCIRMSRRFSAVNTLSRQSIS